MCMCIFNMISKISWIISIERKSFSEQIKKIATKFFFLFEWAIRNGITLKRTFFPHSCTIITIKIKSNYKQKRFSSSSDSISVHHMLVKLLQKERKEKQAGKTEEEFKGKNSFRIFFIVIVCLSLSFYALGAHI